MLALSHSTPLPGETIAILAATTRDAVLARETLEKAGWMGKVVSKSDSLRAALDEGCAALLLAEEACSGQTLDDLGEYLESQPVWSDLPILFLLPAPRHDLAPGEGNKGFERVAKWIPRGNISFLERPLKRATMIAAVEFALRARARQYAQRDLLAEKESEVVRRDEFLAMLGHELRNPLAAIRYAVELLDVLDESQETQTPREVIARQTRTLGRLVDDLLDVARVTRGKIALEKVTLDLNEVARKTLSSLEAANKVSAHHVEFVPYEHPLSVQGDPVRLEQVFSNLLYNAIKYTPHGGHIRVRAFLEEENAVIAIQDNGIGMDATLLPRVFDLFSQSAQAIDRARGGLGIGLTLVRGLVELQGGQVVARSEGAGQGSTFEVRLPLFAPSQAAPSSPPALEAKVARHIVVIEDNEDARDLVCLLLKRDGHRVEGAGDGPSGLELLLQAKPDIAFVDIGLPQMDGYEVVQHVRQKMGQGIRMIAVTGYGQPEDAKRALKAGFDTHLTKPVSHAALREVVAQVSKSAP